MANHELSYLNQHHSLQASSIFEGSDFENSFQQNQHESTQYRTGLFQLQKLFPPASVEISVEEQRIYEQKRKLALIAWLQKDFDSVLPHEAKAREKRKAKGEIQTYNVVLNVASWLLLEMGTQNLSTEEIEAARKNWDVITAFDIQTNLRERFHVRDNTYKMIYKNGKIYSPLLSMDKPFEDFLDDGVKYRKREGSQESEREEYERDGFVKKFQKDFLDAPVGTQWVFISPPGESIIIDDSETGLKKELKSNYSFNFVDIHTKKQDPYTKEYNDEVTRFTSSLSSEEYKKIIKENFDSDFDQKDSHIKFDAKCLGSPFYVPAEKYKDQFALFERLFSYDPEAMREEDFKEIYQVCTNAVPGFPSPQELYLQTVRNVTGSIISNQIIDWKKLSVRFNGILNIADAVYYRKQINTSQIAEVPNTLMMNNLVSYTPSQIDSVGLQTSRTVGSGCGNNSGIELGDNSFSAFTKVNIFLNSVLNPFGNLNANENIEGDCVKISCSRCKEWTANDAEANKIQKGELTCCPKCGWKPGDSLIMSKNSKEQKKDEHIQKSPEIFPQKKSQSAPVKEPQSGDERVATSVTALGQSITYIRKQLKEEQIKNS